jgi:hypothetical protein
VSNISLNFLRYVMLASVDCIIGRNYSCHKNDVTVFSLACMLNKFSTNGTGFTHSSTARSPVAAFALRDRHAIL